MITTIEELDAVPMGSVIRGVNGYVLTKGILGWWCFAGDAFPPEEVAGDMTPATLLIPTTINREKLSELEAAVEAALNAVTVSLGAADDPDQWDMEARAVTEATLKTLGIEVSDD